MSNSAIGKSWEEVERELFTQEEIAESRLRVALIGEIIKAGKSEDQTKNRPTTCANVRMPEKEK